MEEKPLDSNELEGRCELYLPEADDVVGRPAGEEDADEREGDADRVQLGLAQPPRRGLTQLLPRLEGALRQRLGS